MSHRFLVRLSVVVALFVAATLVAPVFAIAQTEPDTWTPQRTSWGAPDLQGVWDFRTITPMERPSGFEYKDVLSDQEVACLLYTSPSPRDRG